MHENLMTAKDCLEEATRLVGGDRAKTHGNKYDNHRAIAAVWNGILEARKAAGRGDQPLSAEDVANLMEGLKIARRYCGTFNPDDYVDGAGYAAVAMECARDEISQSWVKAWREDKLTSAASPASEKAAKATDVLGDQTKTVKAPTEKWDFGSYVAAREGQSV